MERGLLTAEEPQDLLVWIDLGTYGTDETTPCLFSYDAEQPDRLELVLDALCEEGTEPVRVHLARSALSACLNGELPDAEGQAAIEARLSDDGQFVTLLFFRNLAGIVYAEAARLRDLLDQSYALMSVEAELDFISARLDRELDELGLF